MSAFGHNTFKQEVLDEIEALMRQHKLGRLAAIAEVLDVARYMADEQVRSASKYREEVIQDFLKQYVPNQGKRIL